MGRRKGQIAQMGSSSLLVKEKNKRQPTHRNHDSFLHTTDLDDGVTYNRINFQSVTEQSNLEDFLNTAEMAGKDFTAERQNISIITNPGMGQRLTAADLRDISQAQHTHKALLQIPRRPYWNERTTKEELLMLERDSFTDWRRQLKLLEEKDHIQLTPYEKNLDFWRQLWRVIERSDVVVQIVDARNPLLFRCEDLETYVKQVDPNKAVMLLINKADFLTKQQRLSWVDYFNNNGVRAVFFSAMTEKDKMESASVDPRAKTLREDSQVEEEESDEDYEEEDKDVDETKTECNQVTELDKVEENLCSRLTESVAVEEKNTDIDDGACGDGCGNSGISDKDGSERIKIDSDAQPEIPSNQDVETTLPTEATDVRSGNHPDIVTSEELLDIFRRLAQQSCSARANKAGVQGVAEETETVRTVGMVGYPNVGKSSTINVILQQKKLAVSATPGRTKHLQTLYVDNGLMLCDCPGLVFPSFVATKAHLVINGILPIDELRDHVSPTNLICDHIPRAVLEATYSIMIPRPSVDDAQERPPTAEELLFAYGGMRGFMTPRGVPDAPRASRYILKDYVKGKLLYCEPPPGLDGAGFQDKDRVTKLEVHRPVMKKPVPQMTSAIDKEFFSKREGKAHSRGKRGVADHVRTDTLQPTARQVEGSTPLGLGAASSSLGDSQSSLASNVSGVAKPWKKHNNRNKKDKLRRIHRDLDIH